MNFILKYIVYILGVAGFFIAATSITNGCDWRYITLGILVFVASLWLAKKIHNHQGTGKLSPPSDSNPLDIEGE